MIEKKEFMEVMTALGATFQKELDKVLLKVYYDRLKNHNLKDLKNACEIIMDKNIYFPKIAEIKQIINGDLETKANEALHTASERRRLSGSSGGCKFDDPVINETIKLMGGWRAYAGGLISEEKWIDKRFVEIYKQQAEKKQINDNFIELENKENRRLDNVMKQLNNKVVKI